MTIVYLINRYPEPTHGFIAREILALEELGVQVVRRAVRRPLQPVTEGLLRDELEATRYLFDAGWSALPWALMAEALTRPLPFLRACLVAWRLWRHARRRALAHVGYLAEACRLRRDREVAGAVHLHAHFGTNPAAVAWLLHELGGPAFSFTIHGPEEFRDSDRLAVAAKVAAARFVVCVSEAGRRRLRQIVPSNMATPVHVVHCGLPSAWWRDTVPPPPAAPRLVTIARLDEQKDPLLLVAALDRAVREVPSLELEWIGDGPLRETVARAIADAGLGDRVRLWGWQPEHRVRRALERARALVLSSRDEGLPVVAMEALARGRPVIATDVGGLFELVTPAVGRLVPPGDPGALAEAMIEIARLSPGDIRALGAAGRQRVATHHDAGREAAVLLALFRQASAGREAVA